MHGTISASAQLAPDVLRVRRRVELQELPGLLVERQPLVVGDRELERRPALGPPRLASLSPLKIVTTSRRSS
jgi:hypothetical protein